MDYIIVNGELYHHGVKGMKWGVRRNLDIKKSAYKKAKVEYDKSFDYAYKRNRPISITKKSRQANKDRWDDAIKKKDLMDKAKYEYKVAKKQYKNEARNIAITEKNLKKLEKQEYKTFVEKRSKEILAGESAFGKAYAKLTGSHKYQAQMEYDMNKRAKVNAAWRD